MQNSVQATAGGESVVQVMTFRYEAPGESPCWERMSIAAGEFAEAARRALSERLHDHALGQVLDQILARPPADGEAVEYEGLFSPLRHLIVLAESGSATGTPADDPTYVALEGLDPAAPEAPQPNGIAVEALA
jgi:hypothetical protein